MLLVVGLLSFFILDSFRISTGDDLGYMFADSRLHSGDGAKINNIVDCLTTQSKHYFTTNGRIFIHCLVQMFVGVLPSWIFTFCNTLMFCILWIMTVKLSSPNKLTESRFIIWLISLALIWLFLPIPGMSLLSLVAYAVGYLWSAVVGLIWIYLLKFKCNHKNKKSERIFFVFFSLFVAVLHEGVSLPLSLVLVTLFIIEIISVIKNRERKLSDLFSETRVAMIIAFGIGSLLLALAPGNFAHLNQAGGFSANSILNRQIALWPEVMHCGIGVLPIVLIIYFAFNRIGAKEFIKHNKFELLIIVASLLLAVFSFTSARQLFWPSAISIVLICKLLVCSLANLDNYRQRIVCAFVGLCLAAILFGAGVCRKQTYDTWQKFLTDYQSVSKQGGNTVVYDVRNCNYNIFSQLYGCLSMYDCDPAEGSVLHVFFDGYTKRALSRLYCNGNANKISHIVPKLTVSDMQKAILQSKNAKIHPSKIDNRYSVIKLSRNDKRRPWTDSSHSQLIPYEEFLNSDYRLIVIRSGNKYVYLHK